MSDNTKIEHGRQVAERYNERQMLRAVLKGSAIGAGTGALATALPFYFWGMDANGKAPDMPAAPSAPSSPQSPDQEDAAPNVPYAPDAPQSIFELTPDSGALLYLEAPVASSVDDGQSFGEAFAAARAELGAGAVFVWHGQIYNTYYKEEWEAMSSEAQGDYAASISIEVPAYIEPLAAAPLGEADMGLPPLDLPAAVEAVEADMSDEEALAALMAAMAAEAGALDIIDVATVQIAPIYQSDADADGIVDAVMLDTDGDMVADVLENSQGILLDTDFDGIMDSTGVYTEEGIVVGNPLDASAQFQAPEMQNIIEDVNPADYADEDLDDLSEASNSANVDDWI